MKDLMLAISLILGFANCIYAFLYIDYILNLKLTAKRIVVFTIFAFINLLFLLITNFQNVPIALSFFINFFLLFAEYIIIYKTKVIVLLAISAGYTFHIVCARSLSFSIIAILRQNSLYESVHHSQYRILCLLLTNIFLICVFVFYKHSWTSEDFACLFSSNQQMRNICIVEGTLLVYQLICSDSYHIDVSFFWFTSFHFFSSLIALWVHYLLFDRAIKFGVWISKSFKNDIINEQLARQLSHYEAYKKHFDSFIEFRPEFDKMIGAVRHNVINDNFDAACELLQKVNDNVQQIESQHIQFSNNVLLDSILWDAWRESQEKHIEFTANVFVPDGIPLSDLEYSRIFSNLCANALEACEKIGDNAGKYIKFNSSCVNGWLTVTAINSFIGNIKMVNGLPETSKDEFDMHGLGIPSILSILNKHQGFGEVNINNDTKDFKFSLHLPLK